MPGSLSDAWEQNVLAVLLNGNAGASAAAYALMGGSPRYLALFTATLTEAGPTTAGTYATGELVPAAGGYTRQPILPAPGAAAAFTSVGPNVAWTNTGTVSFSNLPAATIVAFAIYENEVVVNTPMFYCNLAASIVVAAAGAIVFPPGSITVTLD